MKPAPPSAHFYPIQGGLAVRVFACFAFAYFISYGMRVINAVIAPSLTAELGISNAVLGSLSATFFIGFFFMQFPLGHWLDKYGSRKSEAFLMLFAVFGSFCFAIADSVALLTLGRGFIGIGVSACLMGALTYYKRWFKPEQQATLASAMLMFGTSGAMLVTIPVEMALPMIGRQGIFLVMTGLIVIAMLIIYFGLPKGTDPVPTAVTTQQEKSFAWLRAYSPILKSGHFLRILPMVFFTQGGFHALHALWLGAWLKDLLVLPSHEVASHLLIFNFVVLCSYGANLFIPLWLHKKGISIALYSSLLGGCAIMMQVFALSMSPHIAIFFIFLFGLCSTSFILAQSQFNQLFPNAINGKASTSFNMLIFGGAFVIQWGIGLLMDGFIDAGYTKAGALRLALQILVGIQVISFAWLWIAPKVLHPSRFIFAKS